MQDLSDVEMFCLVTLINFLYKLQDIMLLGHRKFLDTALGVLVQSLPTLSFVQRSIPCNPSSYLFRASQVGTNTQVLFAAHACALGLLVYV